MKINSINAQYNNYNVKNKQQNVNAPAFKGVMTNKLSSFYSNVAKTDLFHKFIGRFSRSNNTFQHLLIGESIFLSGFYMINTLRNKKIEKEQKPQMVINDTLTLGVSTAGAYLVEDKIAQAVTNFAEKYFVKHKDFYTELGQKAQEKLKERSIPTDISKLLNKVGETAKESGEKLTQGLDDVTNMMKLHLKNIVGDGEKLKAFQVSPETMEGIKTSVKDAIVNNKGNAEQTKEVVKGLVEDVYTKSAARVQADKAMLGFNKIKTLIIFGIIYRYLGPVVVTPIANKLSSKLFNKKNKAGDKLAASQQKSDETKTTQKK